MKITADFLSSLKGFTCTGKPDPVLVEKAEKELGLSFAEDYRALALEYGAISYRGHNLSGLSPYPGNDVVTLTKEHRAFFSEVPGDFYVLEEAHLDGMVIWQDSDGKIYLTQPGAEPKQVCDCLYDYIAQESCE